MEDSLLSDALNRSQTVLGLLQVLAFDEHRLVIQARTSDNSPVIIMISNHEGPMYSVTYEAFSPEAMSITEAQTQTSVVVLDGFRWIVDSVRKHGYALPESFRIPS